MNNNPPKAGYEIAKMVADLERKAESIEPRSPEPLPKVSREDLKRSRRVPEEHVRAVYDIEPAECDALRIVREWLATEKRILVLSGGVGTRKSGSACWALTQKPGRFVMAEELPDMSMATVKEEPDTRELYRSLRTCGLLVVDDLGTEYDDGKGYFVRIFNALMTARTQEMLRTIITCNLPLEPTPTHPGFEKKYGVRLRDRLELGEFHLIGGPSVRRK